MISKLTKPALIAMWTLTLLAAIPQSLKGQAADALSAPAGRLTITWNINLAGPAFNGVIPVGAAEYEVEGGRYWFSDQADNVNLPDGTTLNVYVGGNPTGAFWLTDGGGGLLLDMFAHQKVPTVNKGTPVAIYHGSTKIVSGKF